MKLGILFSLFLIFSCQEKDATPEFQAELFSYIEKQESSRPLKCEPSFSTWRNDELTIYCQTPSEAELLSHMGEMDPEAAKVELREMIRDSTTSITMKWTQEKNRKTKSILTRFSDEIHSEPKK